MKSFNESEMSVEYKSGLELKAFKYASYNQHIKAWSAEPFHIKYLSPKDNKIHRYYIDMYIEFHNGKKFLVEVKSSSETRKPRKPRKDSEKAKRNYNKAMMTYLVNQAKWDAAIKFCEKHGFKFIILTERELSI